MQLILYILRRLLCLTCFSRRHDDEQQKHHNNSNNNNNNTATRISMPVPNCRSNGCEFYGSVRFGGYCSVCYRKRLAKRIQRRRHLQASLIPIPIKRAGLPVRFASRRYLRGIALRPSGDILAKHDALIAELNAQIKIHQEISPSLVSSKLQVPTGTAALEAFKVVGSSENVEGNSNSAARNVKPIDVFRKSIGRTIYAPTQCPCNGKVCETHVVNKKKPMPTTALASKSRQVDVKQRPK